MLARNSYSRAYIDQCRAAIGKQLSAYKAVAAAATPELESLLMGNLVIVLDRQFVHRTRALEGKDGNALNEVRLVCDSLLEHQGVLTASGGLRYIPEQSILKLPIGSTIRLTAKDFTRLHKAYFSAIEEKFT